VNINSASLKAKIRNMSKDKNISAQVILQNFMFERFLERLSLSAYRDKFILKGGLLIAAMVGLETRATMDLDTTLRSYPLDESHLKSAMIEICAIPIDDGVTFRFVNILPIRKDDEYGGLRVSLNGIFEIIKTPLSVDITSGDAITPKPIRRSFRAMFDESKQIELWAYNIETILAEKAETILRRGVFNTRPRDFYDIYILTKNDIYDSELFRQALSATSAHRKTTEQIKNVPRILEVISNNHNLKSQWDRYQREYPYAREISFESIVQALKDLLIPL
jgi:predicted nucleotidyltransferase component of viral defense system